MRETPAFLQTLELSAQEIRDMPDAALVAILSGEDGDERMLPMPLQQAITAELLSRSIAKGSKPHWSVVPSFWLLVLTAILTSAALVVAIIGLPQTQQRLFPAAQVAEPTHSGPDTTAPKLQEQKRSEDKQPSTRQTSPPANAASSLTR